MNLTNCHTEVCRIKFYQIVTSDVLISLSQFDVILINWDIFLSTEYITGAPKEARCFFSQDFSLINKLIIGLAKSSFVVQVFYYAVL